MALQSAPETPSFLCQLHTFFRCEFLKVGRGSGIHVHWDYVGIRIVLCQHSVLVLRSIVMTCLLIVMLCVCEPCVVFFFGPGDFSVYCRFPFIHSARDFVPIQRLAMDPLAQAFSEAYNGSFSIEGPTSSESESFKGGDVGINIPSSHGEFHELVVRVLFLGHVHPGVVKCRFELHPEYLVVFKYVVWSGGVCVCC